MAEVAVEKPAEAAERERVPGRLSRPASFVLWAALVAVQIAWIGAFLYVILRLAG